VRHVAIHCKAHIGGFADVGWPSFGSAIRRVSRG
jgi:hypothetical protein